jgi:hypothetical protein
MPKTLFELLTAIIVGCIIMLVLFGWKMDKASLVGHTPAEVRSEFGEPYSIADFRKEGGNVCRWRYQRGLLAWSDITFDNNDVVIDVQYGAPY